MEDSLTLEELIELYDISHERQNRLLKTVAAAFGAEVEESSSSGGQKNPVYDQHDLVGLPIGIGYETMG